MSRRSRLGASKAGGSPLRSMMRTASCAHRSQIYARRPATSFSTSAALLPQNEHDSMVNPSISNPAISTVDLWHISIDQYIDNYQVDDDQIDFLCRSVHQ